jgi:hypothetical protein
MPEVQTTTTREVARSLRVLVPLIKEDLAQAREASERAGVPHYRAAGEKIHEARRSGEMSLTELCSWTKRNFNVGRTQTFLYMSYAKATAGLSAQADHPSLHEHRTRSLGHKQTVYPRAWHEDVKSSIEQAKRDMDRVREENLNREQERLAQRKLAMRLIDIGYKVLAKELHPDKGGTREAMTRLVTVRDRLRKCM